jgi:hypothetical protein
MAEKKKSYKRYKDFKTLVALADQAVEVKGKGRKGKRGETHAHIITDEARDLFEEIAKDGKYSDAEKAAAAHIREEYEFTDAGKAVFAQLLRDWALERGRATQAAAREEAKEEDAKEEAKKAGEKKAKAKAKAKENKKTGPRTTKIGEDELDFNLVKFALKCVDANITKARGEISEEDYDKGSLGGKQMIGVDDVDALLEIVFEDGEYSELEKDTMAWIRSNIGMTKAARASWSKKMPAAKAAAKQK